MKKRFLGLIVLAVQLLTSVAGVHSEWATKVYDFLPAPGQFVNVLPACKSGEPRDSVLARAQKFFCGYRELDDYGDSVFVKPKLISLGAFGGYIVFGFDHPVVNSHDYDFKVFGNAFQAESSTAKGGSSEPGIVMVSRDVNGNGVPDDAWYELAGSEYNHPKTQHNYRIVYHKPADLTKAVDVAWTSNDTDSLRAGVVNANAYHDQPYWPLWIAEDSLVFTGTKLRCNAVDESGKGTYYVQHFFDWGYVDNRPNDTDPGFKIDWAVDEAGKPVALDRIDFVKVYCAENQMCGWLGETSTEVNGAIDLHPDAPLPPLKGDLNGDDKVDMSDVTVLTGLILDPAASVNAVVDLNGDGKVDVSDVTLLINMIMKQ